MTDPVFPTKYNLFSVATGQQYEESGWVLDPPANEPPSLLRADYANKQLHFKNAANGLFQFADWLPLGRPIKGSSAPVTYKSEALAKHLKLSNLYITFSGYWPERGAAMSTCSFKETEAYTVCSRLRAEEKKVLVVASAGNTARAFAKVCSDNQIPLLLCVPRDYINALWFDAPLNQCVKLVVTDNGSDYYDAIHLSNIVCKLDGFIAEGGAKNIARRDGMGTTMLSATTFIGRIPDYYFQAVGSGTGAIAAWEANLRFIEDGRFGDHKMKLMVSQNSPFLPIYDAWKARSRHMLPYDDDQARKDVEIIDAKVLSNRKPPYPIAGGLFDALMDTDGEVLAVNNEDAAKASRLFEQLEGIDIHPAAAVAVASLIQTVEKQEIALDATVMLNITGGGEKRFKSEKELFFLQPEIVFSVTPDPIEVATKLSALKF